MEKSRGKKSKKTGWRLSLGLKETIFAGIGVVGLMMMSFALGALAGRGDIYRAAYSWGLMSPAQPKVAQWTPATGATGGQLAAAPAAPATPEPPNPTPATPAPPPAAAPVAKAPAPVAAKPGKPGVITGSIAPLPPPEAAATVKKKGKGNPLHKDHKAREEERRRLHQEMVQKLNFLNSFDNTPKPRVPKSKDHEKAQAKSQPAQVRVAQYRKSKEAQAKVAELRKKGIKATCRKTKDSKGTLYIVYKLGASHHTEPEKLAKKPEKHSGIAKKPRIE